MSKLRWILTSALLVMFAVSAPSRAATPEEVDKAIEKAKGWLYSQQQNGHWDNEPPPQKRAPSSLKKLSA